MVETGCDILYVQACERLKDSRIGLLANPASVTSDLRHTSEILLSSGIDLVCLFGPQHGYSGESQANMIEWEGYIHPRLHIPVHSLYGERREPSSYMLKGLDTVVIDLPDVGARPYTYLWTAVLMVRACADAGVEVLVLDRPNPIGGEIVEGPMLEDEFKSFVGLYPLPMRHGLTFAEALNMLNERERLGCRLDIIKMRGWERSMPYHETGLPWILPSPNMPSPDTALVYPGTVLLEGTNISEGRGTTRPFEMVGAPWIDPEDFAIELSKHRIDGVAFRPARFMPTWDKYRDEACGGVQIHVLDSKSFKPVRCGTTVIATAAWTYPEHFRWKEPPYEYELELPPIDIIAGSAGPRTTIESGKNLPELFESWEKEEERFKEKRKGFFLY